jgi:hypothetical protein
MKLDWSADFAESQGTASEWSIYIRYDLEEYQKGNRRIGERGSISRQRELRSGTDSRVISKLV